MKPTGCPLGYISVSYIDKYKWLASNTTDMGETPRITEGRVFEINSGIDSDRYVYVNELIVTEEGKTVAHLDEHYGYPLRAHNSLSHRDKRERFVSKEKTAEEIQQAVSDDKWAVVE
jgi:hypothetical protein